jgi:hypothetical protein
MDDSLTLFLKTDTTGTKQPLVETEQAMIKVKNAAKETTVETAKGKTGAMALFHEFHAGALAASGSLKGLAMAMGATGIGLLIVAAGMLFEAFKKLDFLKNLFGGITDAIGLTTNAEDKLAKADKERNEYAEAGLKNELALLQAQGATMDEIYQKKVEIARQEFETQKAKMIADAGSAKTQELAKKGGEDEIKLNQLKTNYYVLLAGQKKTMHDTDTKNIDEIRLLKEKDLEKDLDEIEIWYKAESAKYPTDYSLYLLYEEKKTAARKKNAEEVAKETKKDADKKDKEVADDFKRWTAYWDKVDKEEADRADEKWDEGVKNAEKLFKKNQDLAQDSWNDMLDVDAINLKTKADLGKISQKNYLKQQYDDEIAEAIRAGKDTTVITAKYNAEVKKGKQALNKAIADAAIEISQKASDAIFQYETDSNNRAMQKELDALDEKNHHKTGAEIKLQAEQDVIKKKYFEKQKKTDISQALINGALGITKALADGLPIYKWIDAALIAVTTGIEVATIRSKQYSLGGIVQGASHQNGGVNIGNGNEAEGGEGMINKRSMSNPLIAAEAMRLNAMGNNGTANNYIPLTENRVAVIASQVLKSVPVIITEKSVTDKQHDALVLDSRFSKN